MCSVVSVVLSFSSALITSINGSDGIGVLLRMSVLSVVLAFKALAKSVTALAVILTLFRLTLGNDEKQLKRCPKRRV